MSKFEKKSLIIVLKTLFISSAGIAYYLYRNYFFLVHNHESVENLYPYLILFTFSGLHSFFALLTYILSKVGMPYILRLRCIIFSLITPFLFICVNIFTIGSYEFTYWLIIPLVYFVYKDIREDIIGTYFKMYLNVLVNPYGKEDEFFLMNVFDRWEMMGDERYGIDED